MRKTIIKLIGQTIFIVFINALMLSPINAKGALHATTDKTINQTEIFTDALVVINNWLGFDLFEVLQRQGVLMGNSRKKT